MLFCFMLEWTKISRLATRYISRRFARTLGIKNEKGQNPFSSRSIAARVTNVRGQSPPLHDFRQRYPANIDSPWSRSGPGVLNVLKKPCTAHHFEPSFFLVYLCKRSTHKHIRPPNSMRLFSSTPIRVSLHPG